MNASRFITTIIFVANSILAFAEYDGRLADDPYHKSPTWLYIIIIIGIIYAILKGVCNNSKSEKTNKSTIQNCRKTAESTSHKQYNQYGRYWEDCPSCKGRGWVDGKEVWYLVSPPESVCCDKCKGYGRQLTPEAEHLHAEYIEQYNKEQVEKQRDRDQRQKQREEEQRRIREERWQKKQQAITNIKAAGRKVLKEEEYTTQLVELRSTRKDLIATVMSMLKNEPICPICQNKESRKYCSDCRGTGHILTDSTLQYIDEGDEILARIKQLRLDYNAIYQPVIDASISSWSLNNFVSNLFPENQSINVPKSTTLKNRIIELLKEEPYCYHCMAAGHLKVRKDYSTDKAYEQVVCTRCNGSGRLHYD